MKNILIVILLLVAGIAVLVYLTKKPNSTGEQNTTNNATSTMESQSLPVPDGTYRISPSESTITWTAEKPLILGYTHHGTFSVRDGAFSFENAVLTGEFVLDMTALRVTSLGGGKAGNESRLETHLKSGDFFDVETYPTAKFTVTSATPVDEIGTYQIIGDLTLKDITEEIAFTAHVAHAEGSVQFNGNTEIDRTKWNIVFGSASFFDNLADNAISNTVGLTISIVAQKEG